MKTRILLVFFLMLASVFAERDFRPVGRMENIPASNASIQQCYIFRTIPGVVYLVESTHDLSAWTAGDEFYGVGHEYAVAMREFTPPPPPPPGGGGQLPTGNATPTRLVGLRMLPSSGTAGGVVVSWRSLDNDAPVNMLLAQTMAPEWNNMPLFFSERYSAYYFSVGCGGLAPIPPPAENPVLGPKDAEMFAQLETSFPLMNQSVIESTARARITPPPAPPDPMSRKFWRVFCDWSLDTDMDGSPDWAEFEISGIFADGLRGDAFDADTNHNGIPDGDELDLDQDGTPDAKDPDVDDSTVVFRIVPVPRYALFPITNAATGIQPPKAFQINDKGTVLYGDGTWKAGTWTPLTLKVTGEIVNASARGINDSDQILGIGYDDASSSSASYFAGLSCYWSTPNAQPAIVETSGDNSVRAGLPSTVPPANVLSSPNSESGPSLANDGGFYCPTYRLKEDRSEWIFQHDSRWKLPSNGQPIAETPAADTLRFSTGTGLQWGFDQIVNNEGVDYKGVGGSILGIGTLPALPFMPTNVFYQPGSYVLAFPASSDESAQVFKNGIWKTSRHYKPAIDMSARGIAIGRGEPSVCAPILLNDKWKVISDYAPEVPERWKDSTVQLLDTTPGGWVLAERGNFPLLGVSFPEHAVLLPIRADGVDPALPAQPTVPPTDPPEYPFGGVDHTSMSAHSGTGRVPEIWIMAPNGGASNSVRFQSPLNPDCKLTWVSTADIDYTPSELNSGDMVVQVKGKNTATADHTAQMKLGGTVDPLSVPLKIKAMKKRTVKVAVHKIFGKDAQGNQTVPTHFPTMTDLDAYLNEVFGRQANTFFQCTQHDEKGPNGTGIDFDLVTSDGKIGYASTDPEVQELTKQNPQSEGSNATANIDIWVFGGKVQIADADYTYNGYKIGEEFKGTIIIDGDLVGSTGTADELSKELLNVFAHEIGHVMLGSGHAHDGTCKSVLVWRLSASGKYQTDFRNNTRLMATRLPKHMSKSRKQLIKKEWDLMEAWLKKQEDDGRL